MFAYSGNTGDFGDGDPGLSTSNCCVKLPDWLSFLLL